MAGTTRATTISAAALVAFIRASFARRSWWRQT
jgi:hypothetical protein